jgi:hypothetical protein
VNRSAPDLERQFHLKDELSSVSLIVASVSQQSTGCVKEYRKRVQANYKVRESRRDVRHPSHRVLVVNIALLPQLRALSFRSADYNG